LSKFGFDKKLEEQRDKFDLAFVLNGYQNEAIEFISKFNPDYFFLRPNIGYDPAAVEHLLKLIPIYNTTLILHDDHWFEDSNWLEKIIELRTNNPKIDIWGNIFNSLPPNDIEKYFDDRELTILTHSNSNDFLHGLSGVYTSNAINKLKKFSFNFPLTFDKHTADLGERTFSYALKYLELSFEQFPEGIFKFLLHNESNERDHLFWTANILANKGNFREARDYFFEYLKFCEEHDFQRDYLVAFFNIAQTSFVIEDYNTAVEYAKKCLTISHNFPEAIDLINKIKEKLNV